MKTEILELILTKLLTAEEPTSSSAIPVGQHIVVLDRGFVYVGETSEEKGWLKISKARNIRVWGTKNGLGELRNGPLKDTVLDECETVLVPQRAIISLIPCRGF